MGIIIIGFSMQKLVAITHLQHVTEVLKQRGMDELHYTPAQAETAAACFMRHCQVVATVAQTIASRTTDLDPEYAFICGLIHDIGRIDISRFHGLVGYEMMQALHEPELARICLTHTFIATQPNANYTLTDSLDPGHFYNKFGIFCQEDLDKTQALLVNMQLNDYDYLIKLADFLSDGQHDYPVSITTRILDLHQRYANTFTPDSFDTLAKNLQDLRHYWENRLHLNLYDLLHISNI